MAHMQHNEEVWHIPEKSIEELKPFLRMTGLCSLNLFLNSQVPLLVVLLSSC